MRRRLLCVALSGLVMTACGEGAGPQGNVVDIRASDGVILEASYFSPGKPGPAIVLFHQCNMDRRAWNSLAGDLTAAGFHVLAADQRGFGDSGGPIQGQIDGGPDRLAADDDAVYERLLSQAGVDRARVAAGGASCGVTQSIDLASRHAEIKALVLLSGFASKGGLAHIAATPSLPIFGAVSKYDDVAASIQEIVGASKNTNSIARVFPGHWFDLLIGRGEHGVGLFRRNPELRREIVGWLVAQLAGSGGELEAPPPAGTRR